MRGVLLSHVSEVLSAVGLSVFAQRGGDESQRYNEHTQVMRMSDQTPPGRLTLEVFQEHKADSRP